VVYTFQLFPPHQNSVSIASHTRATRIAYSIMHQFNILKITKLSLCILLRPSVTSSLSSLPLNSSRPRSRPYYDKATFATKQNKRNYFSVYINLHVLDRKRKTKKCGPSVSKHSPYFIGYYIIHARNFELFTSFPNILKLLHVQKFCCLLLCHDFVLHSECYSYGIYNLHINLRINSYYCPKQY